MIVLLKKTCKHHSLVFIMELIFINIPKYNSNRLLAEERQKEGDDSVWVSLQKLVIPAPLYTAP